MLYKGHVNNVTYVKYAESGRINWAQNFANYIDPKHKKEWSELWTPKGNGLILRSMKTDYKFVGPWAPKKNSRGLALSTLMSLVAYGMARSDIRVS